MSTPAKISMLELAARQKDGRSVCVVRKGGSILRHALDELAFLTYFSAWQAPMPNPIAWTPFCSRVLDAKCFATQHGAILWAPRLETRRGVTVMKVAWNKRPPQHHQTNLLKGAAATRAPALRCVVRDPLGPPDTRLLHGASHCVALALFMRHILIWSLHCR